jgi:hypothetical protein
MTLGRLLLRAVLVVAIPVALAVLVVKWRVAVTLDRWIEQAQPFAQIGRGSSFVGLDGTIGVDQLAITANQTDIGTLRADRVTLHTPGLWWVVRTGLLGGDRLPSQFGISVDGLDTSLLEVGRDQPTLVGELSGAPFDHAGCQPDPFIEGELIGLGVPRAAPRTFARYAIAADGALRVDSGIERARSASSNIALLLRLPGTATPDAASLMGASFEGVELSLRDDGFAAARNSACAERLKISEADFVAAHVAMAQRIARALGFAPDAVWWEEYARFAATGGSLDLIGTPQRPLPLMALARSSGPPGAQFSWQLSRDGGAARRTEIASIAPQPLDGGKPRTLAGQLQVEMDAERAQQRAGTTQDLQPPPAVPGDTAGAVTDAAPPVAVAPIRTGPWTTIDYANLAERIGSTLQVETIHGSRREGTLEQWNPAGMVLRLGPDEGGIPLSLAPRDLRTIRIRD